VPAEVPAAAGEHVAVEDAAVPLVRTLGVAVGGHFGPEHCAEAEASRKGGSRRERSCRRETGPCLPREVREEGKESLRQQCSNAILAAV
jgi:hypothetical protein